MTPGKHSRALARATNAGFGVQGLQKQRGKRVVDHSAASRHHAHLSSKRPQAAERRGVSSDATTLVHPLGSRTEPF